jgi:seryl-tRNA synthetase
LSEESDSFYVPKDKREQSKPDNDECSKRNAKLRVELAEEKEYSKLLESKKTELLAAIQSLTSENSSLKTRIRTLFQERDSISNSLANTIKEKEKTIESLKGEISNSEKQSSRLRQELTQKQRELDERPTIEKIVEKKISYPVNVPTNWYLSAKEDIISFKDEHTAAIVSSIILIFSALGIWHFLPSILRLIGSVKL